MRLADIRARTPCLVLLAALALLGACSQSSDPPSSDAHGHGEAEGEHAELEKGPHGGRLLADEDFALEITIFESGVPPEFRIYPTWKGQSIPPQDVQLTIQLSRVNGLPGGKVDKHTFVPKGDYLVSSQDVYEPHSFVVEARAQHAGKEYSWSYDSPEGRVSIATDMAATQGLTTDTVVSGEIIEARTLYGSIQPNAERVRAVAARFPGVVQSVSATVGDQVKAGQTLARVESNESLQVYSVTAPLAGTVTKRSTNPGESAGGAPLFEIADFSTVWAELTVFPRDRGRLHIGQAVEIAAADGAATGSGKISYVSSVGSDRQSLVARIVLDNSKGEWTPGQFVNGHVTVASANVEKLVPLTALQGFRDWNVVFVNDGETYQAQPVELGRRDRSHVEILSGVEAGARVAVSNSFLVKADIEKSGASHDH